MIARESDMRETESSLRKAEQTGIQVERLTRRAAWWLILAGVFIGLLTSLLMRFMGGRLGF